MRYLTFLEGLHRSLEPSTYLEVGIRNGDSLSLSRCRSVGIDPAYHLTAELDCDLALFRTVSDEYFSRPEPLAPFQGRPVELAFIDGLHLFEFALRDFIYVERHSAPTGVIVFDDVFPRTVDEAARERHTRAWTGDVFKVLQVLQRFRQDLVCLRVGTQPTGLLVVTGLDPDSTVLSDRYDEIVAEFVRPDPQIVPDDILTRVAAQPPARVLAAPLWSMLRAARDTPARGDELRRQLAESARSSLGVTTGLAARQPAG